MKVCGIELKSNEARIVVLEGHIESYDIVQLDTNKFKLEDSKDQKAVQQFRDQILEFFKWQDFDCVGIKERITKGRFAGGAISFKIEGLIQTSDCPVQLVHNMSMKSALKEVDFDPTLVKKYQEEALKVAIYLLKIKS